MSIGTTAALHGVIGIIFLLAFAGVAEVLLDFTSTKFRRLSVYVWVLVGAVVIHNILGTYIYQFYRAAAPSSPRSMILASSRPWLHTFLMEYKEFVGGLVPMLAVAALAVILYYKRDLVFKRGVRYAVLGYLSVAFIFALTAFAFGALITRYAPVG